MRIVSWNVNGIRACLDKGLDRFAKEIEADFLCLQETKAEQNQVEWLMAPTLAKQESIWSSAEKKGYSGVAIFSPHKNASLSGQSGLKAYDAEGRITLAYAKGFTLVNIYFPNGAASEDRHLFKMRFLDEILVYLKKLEAAKGPLVVVGDYNIAHTEIDIHDPVNNKDSSGFKPEERAWMSKFLQNGFIDSFRLLHPSEKDHYSWWSYRMRSRERNKGWRIDYICVSESLKNKIRRAEIHPHILGSDHCPISLDLAL